ncbi:ABC transporter ATP-binding protein [Thermoflexus sp.]|uniref:ABC transporter ATP-binding protein n=1 Tax=Thermoflexus sp. TaxID=1969742 RepID=UPI0025DD76B4|nr:ABC transporter ATP-binding protein [Thermoflexus sp.]MDW8179558.1 ABC transporter ATP-binding protein [Anaerolineae bacterium]MCS6965118.1 ABC transporter ATP-binding protein [Thermoflexus sp.]MCS7350109.1 ABC transporter ATP-binding protein [Thermoflexus sp.]MCX7689473.1 ABC transporter ATP-binding protein [Thermoflexus sp.]MDW8184662.1 ABC transporter ATP-binding protein [Anaerolineae bacterium]
MTKTLSIRPDGTKDRAEGPLLEIRRVSKAFGGLMALMGVSLRVWPGQIKGLIGPNGAGKTTLFNLITGMLRPTSGDIRFQGRSIVGLSPFQIAALGIARTFQNVQLFRGMTVLEHVLVGGHRHSRSGLLGAILRTPRMQREEEEAQARAWAILKRVGLAEWADRPAESLPLGLQRILEIARALAVGPQLMLLDEPGAGLNPMEKARLAELIRSLNAEGMTVLLVEHDMSLVMGLADEIAVLDYGQLIAEGPPEAIRQDPRVIAAYLGEEDEVGHAARG